MEWEGDQGGHDRRALIVTADVLEEIELYVSKWLPFESGGILIGNRIDDTFYADEFVPLEGALPSTHRYLARAVHATRAVLRADREGKCVVATVHSHPDGNEEPSHTDLQNAYGYRDVLHIVVNFRKGAPACRVYKYHRTEEGYCAQPAPLVIATP